MAGPCWGGGGGPDDTGWTTCQFRLITKSIRAKQPVPTSPEVLARLDAYLDEASAPADGVPIWRTRRGEPRLLTAARRITQRAVEELDANCTPHDLQHTAAARMAGDPELTPVEVRTMLRHSQISTTEFWTAAGGHDLVDELAAHYWQPVQPTSRPVQYAADDMEAASGVGRQQLAGDGPDGQQGPPPRERRHSPRHQRRPDRDLPRAASALGPGAPLAGGCFSSAPQEIITQGGQQQSRQRSVMRDFRGRLAAPPHDTWQRRWDASGHDGVQSVGDVAAAYKRLRNRPNAAAG